MLRTVPRLPRLVRRLGLSTNESTLSPFYASLLDDLKSQKPAPAASFKLRQPFNKVVPASVDEGVRRNISWLSQYDPVLRSPFAKDVTHLQSLLDALLTLRNYDRADNILRALHPLVATPEAFVAQMNRYLEAWALEDGTSVAQLQQYVAQVARQFPDARANDRTYAILVARSLRENTSYTALLAESLARGIPKSRILNHIDVLGNDGLLKLFRDPAITESSVPADLVPLFRHARDADAHDAAGDADADADAASAPEYFSKSDAEAPTLEKDAETLRSVDSFGLKVVRHQLLGLRHSKALPALARFLDAAGAHEGAHETVLHNTSSAAKNDFHAVYRSLTLPEERAAFNAALDAHNELRQSQLEVRGADGARRKWEHAFEEMQRRGDLNVGRNLNAQLFRWYQELLPYVEEEVAACRALVDGGGADAPETETSGADTPEKDTPETETSGADTSRTHTAASRAQAARAQAHAAAQAKDRAHYAPYLVLVEPKKMCVITILELIKLNSTGGIVDGMRTARAVISVGKALELEYRAQQLAASEGRGAPRRSKTSKEWRRVLRNRRRAPSAGEWDYPVYAKVGSVLTALLLHVAKVPVTGHDPVTGQAVLTLQPAFHHLYQYLQGQRLGVLKVHKAVGRQLLGLDGTLAVQPQLLPMLVPPRPWTGANDGGYLYLPTSVVRTKDLAETTAYLRAALARGDLHRIYNGLDVLGKTAWTVNLRVLAVVTACWNTGEPFLDIPPVDGTHAMPDPPAFDAEPAVRHAYNRKVRTVLHAAASANSQRCDTNYKLEIARAFVGERLFFPHNVDFRGRAYPLSPHFNHLGNDMTRSLFLFWEGRRLGDRGLLWLKIQLANVYGMDKAPLHEREAFVDAHTADIADLARDPLGGARWWTKAEKPWQALSVCFELDAAYKLANPEDFVSHLPVHQDGTCNGLQHYAALGGDMEGARQVNLVPLAQPNDVYLFVAQLVQKRIDADAQNGDPKALFLQDKITRKVVKQTVMTNVYGVTFIGAVLQIHKQIDKHFGPDGAEDAREHARYLTTLVFASVRELFSGAHAIQDWLGEAARRISKLVRPDDERTPGNKPLHLLLVIWTTPLGLPCVQPYRAPKKHTVSTSLQDIMILDPFGASQVDARKQQAAFPPNFVHLLDATHMLLTSQACGEDSIAFASVHDSYWTHAADVDTMNRHIRSQFVSLHSESLVAKLKHEFERRYRGFLQVVTVPGDLEVAQKVKDVRRAIVKDLGRALTVADELYLERRRQELLSSDDPAVVAMGAKMVTPVSVTEGVDVNALGALATGKAFQILARLEFPEVPERGDLDVGVVRDLKYFFS